jgi:uncharacterized protein YbjT (DUF2867 family)
MSNTRKLIAVVGATGQQGGAVVRALRANGQFKVRALTRHAAQHSQLADEVVQADLNRPETLNTAFAGAYGVFLVTNFWEAGADEAQQAAGALRAAQDAGVQHFIWSTLPNVQTVSGGQLDVPHFTNKAKVERSVAEAGFPSHTFVIAPFYYQNLLGVMAPREQPDGTVGWTLPLNPEPRVLHMGDITELGPIVAGAFSRPELAGRGEHLPLVGDFMSFNEIVATLNRQGHDYSFKQVPKDLFAGAFPGAKEIAEMLAYFEAHTYLGADSREAIALANKVAGRQPTRFGAWARANIAVGLGAETARTSVATR